MCWIGWRSGIIGDQWSSATPNHFSTELTLYIRSVPFWNRKGQLHTDATHMKERKICSEWWSIEHKHRKHHHQTIFYFYVCKYVVFIVRIFCCLFVAFKHLFCLLLLLQYALYLIIPILWCQYVQIVWFYKCSKRLFCLYSGLTKNIDI